MTDYYKRCSKCMESNGFCHYCSKSFQYHELTIDHVVPLSKNGSHSKDNVVFACHSCNSSKGDGEKPKHFRRRRKRQIVKIERPS